MSELVHPNSACTKKLHHVCLQKYKACVTVIEHQVVWLSNPHLVSNHHMCIFLGTADADVKEENWYQSSCYFQLHTNDRAVEYSGYVGIPNEVIIATEELSPKYKKFLAASKSCGKTFFTHLTDFVIHRVHFYFINKII